MPRRRDLLCLAASLGLAPWTARAQIAAPVPRSAFELKTLPELLKALGLPVPLPSKEVTLQAPDLHEDGSVVPLAFACTAPGVQRLLLCVDRNPFLLSAAFEPGDAVEPTFSTRVKMQQSSNVQVLAVLKDGRVLSAAREVKITLGGCGGAAESVPEKAGQPTLIRLAANASGVTVRSLMKHEMESGQRKDESGRTLPAWYIEDVAAQLNGQPVMTAQWGTSISKNPFLQFSVKGAKPGDRVSLAWADNRGNRRSDEASVAAPGA